AAEILRKADPKNLAEWKNVITNYLTACGVPAAQQTALVSAPKTLMHFEEVRRGLLTAAAAPSQKILPAAPRATTVSAAALPALKANATDAELLNHFRSLQPG